MRAVAVNGTTYSDELHEVCPISITTSIVSHQPELGYRLQGIKNGTFEMIIVGPKLCVSTESRFRALLSQSTFSKKILALVVDEAHCISQWGSGFRPEYAELDTVRAFIEIHVAVHLASATMPPIVLAQARRTMHIHAENSFHLNLGNDRPNITWEVHRMSAGKSDLEVLEIIVPSDTETRVTLPRMVVFFDDIMQSMRARRWFVERLPGRLRGRVKTYNARKAQIGRDLTWEQFRNRDVDVLFASESAGMVSGWCISV